MSSLFSFLKSFRIHKFLKNYFIFTIEILIVIEHLGRFMKYVNVHLDIKCYDYLILNCTFIQALLPLWTYLSFIMEMLLNQI